MAHHQTKAAKYDRQLRLWAEHGQALLETARVCLVNGSAVGTEILKNLILPGVGAFTVVDGHKITPRDLANNFFVDAASVGLSRAKRTSELLQELNEDVMGSFVDEDPDKLLDTNPDFISQFTLVIATQIAEGPLLKLAELCWAQAIPLIVARTNGLIGYLRVMVPEHTVVESHPDNPVADLRLDAPPQVLAELCDRVDMDAMDMASHKHVPYVVILLKQAQLWKKLHNEQLPQTRAEKDQFKQMIQDAKRSLDETNFDEATAAAHRVWTPTTVPSDVRQILADPKCNDIDASTPNFWILTRALRDFVNSPNEGNGSLPITGTIPDMEADTDSYITLQTIYRQLALEHVSAITQRVQALLLSINKPLDAIPHDEIRLFCKNAFNLKVIRCRSLQDEYASPRSSVIGNALPDPTSTLMWYVIMRAVDQFEQVYHRVPGESDGTDVDSDIPLLKKSVFDVLTRMGLPTTSVADDHVHEMCRFGGSELHSIAAYIGGVGSQEAIKLITHQFVSMNNTHIYDGISSASTTADL